MTTSQERHVVDPGLLADPPAAPVPPLRRLAGFVAAAVHRAREDVQVVCEKDPAVNRPWEVLLYPHIHALWLHRLAHLLYLRDLRVTARAVALFGRLLSGGIDIHPGARIGRRFFIDHGAGVVIGETVEIGDDVMLYHLVTLGSVGWWRDLARGPGAKRHPTLGDGVVVCTGAAVLGPVTVGALSRIGSHAVVLTSLPEGCRVPAGRVVPGDADGDGTAAGLRDIGRVGPGGRPAQGPLGPLGPLGRKDGRP